MEQGWSHRTRSGLVLSGLSPAELGFLQASDNIAQSIEERQSIQRSQDAFAALQAENSYHLERTSGPMRMRVPGPAKKSRMRRWIEGFLMG